MAKVQLATTIAGILVSDFESGDIIDGVVLSVGDVLLIKNQSNGIENGVYNINISGAPTRNRVFANGARISTECVFCKQGTVNSNTTFICINNIGSDIVGTDVIIFENNTSPNIITVTGNQKGDILVHDGTKFTILPSGTGDVEMIVDLNQPSGLKWKSRKRQFKVSTEVKNTVKTTTYSTVGSFSYDSDVTIKNIKIVSKMQSGITSYDMRLFDATNSQIIAEATFSNIKDRINDIGVLNNFPVADAIFEIQVKKNGGSKNRKITIRDISVSYN